MSYYTRLQSFPCSFFSLLSSVFFLQSSDDPPSTATHDSRLPHEQRLNQQTPNRSSEKREQSALRPLVQLYSSNHNTTPLARCQLTPAHCSTTSHKLLTALLLSTSLHLYFTTSVATKHCKLLLHDLRIMSSQSTHLLYFYRL